MMNIKVDRDLFLSELYYLQGLAGAKQIIPILSHLLIETAPGKITMRATDLDVMITTECQAGVREVGSICLPSRKLAEIAKSLSHGEIDIKTNDQYQATIASNGSRFKLHGASAEGFPRIQEYSGEYAEAPAELFSRFIPRVIHAVGLEGSHYALHGVKLEISEERIRMVATDGHRLALVEREGRFNTVIDTIVSKKALVELAKICAASDEMLLLGKDDNHIRFKLGKREITSCLLAGRYPDYEAILPKENLNRLTLDRDLISPAVKRVALMADGRSRAIKLDIGKRKLDISSQSAGCGEAGETIPVRYEGKKIIAGFNATYLSDIFNALDENEILFEIKNGEAPAQFSIRTPDQDRCLAIVMPLTLTVHR
jgi:DNA polymerase III subunit beta